VTYLDDETPPGSRRIELFRERYPLLLENTQEAAALYARVATRRLPSIVTHTWLHAFGVPNGMCARPLREISPAR
jgi:hypothetical protein